MKDNIYKKELGIGEILSKSWGLFKDNFKIIFYIILIIYVPINLILSFFPIEESFGSIKTYIRLVQVLELLIGIIATMAIAFLIKSKIDKKKVTLKSAFKKSLSRWGAAIGTQLLTGIFLIGLFLLLIVPGIIFSIYWMFVTLAVILNNKSGKNAMDYSKSVVKGRWGKTFGYSLVFALIAVVIIMVLGVLSVIPYIFLPSNFALNTIIDSLFDVAVSYFSVVWVVFYINMDNTKKKVKK